MLNQNLLAFPGDAFYTVWLFWQRAFANNYSLPHPRQILFVYLGDLLTFFSHEVMAYNIIFLGSLLLAFLLTYRLGRSLNLSKQGALLAAWIYTFSQDFLWQGTQHLELVLGAAFLPLFVHKLLGGNLWSKALSFSLVFLSSFYLGYFALLLIVGAAGYDALIKLREKTSLSCLGKHLTYHYGTLALLIFGLTLPATIPLWQTIIAPSKATPIAQDLRTNLKRNTVEEAFRLTARPWDFFLPSSQHPLFGAAVKTFYEKTNPQMSWQLWSAYLPERAIFWGGTATLLALWAVLRPCTLPECYKAAGKGFPRRKLVFLLWFCLWLSLPPYLSFRGDQIPLSPSYFLVSLIPVFRAYIRINFLTKLFLSLLAGLGLEKLLTNYRRPRALWIVILGLVIFENLTPLPLMPVNQLPPLYQWLKEQPDPVLVAEYPQDTDLKGGCSLDLAPQIIKGYSYTYALNFQRLHHQPLFDAWELPEEIQVQLWDLTNPRVYQILKEKGVTHILAHRLDYLPEPVNPLDHCQGRRFYTHEPEVYEKIIKVATLEDGWVYRLD